MAIWKVPEKYLSNVEICEGMKEQQSKFTGLHYSVNSESLDR